MRCLLVGHYDHKQGRMACCVFLTDCSLVIPSSRSKLKSRQSAAFGSSIQFVGDDHALDSRSRMADLVKWQWLEKGRCFR